MFVPNVFSGISRLSLNVLSGMSISAFGVCNRNSAPFPPRACLLPGTRHRANAKLLVRHGNLATGAGSPFDRRVFGITLDGKATARTSAETWCRLPGGIPFHAISENTLSARYCQTARTERRSWIAPPGAMPLTQAVADPLPYLFDEFGREDLAPSPVCLGSRQQRLRLGSTLASCHFIRSDAIAVGGGEGGMNPTGVDDTPIR